jgi:hypothetical protein
MINIIVLLICGGCGVAVFLKTTAVRAAAALIASIIAIMAAFNFYESVAGFVGFIGAWANAFSFLIITILVVALIMAGIVKLTPTPLDLGFLPERIGRAVFGLVLGILASGFVLTFLALAPLSTKLPYARFEQATQSSPNKLLLNVDGLITGLFSKISDGAFRGEKSFATQHPNFLDQLYLNRFKTAGSSGGSTNQQGRGGAGTQGGRGSRGGGGEGGGGGTRGGRGSRGGTPGEGQGGENFGQPGSRPQESGRGFPEQGGQMPAPSEEY